MFKSCSKFKKTLAYGAVRTGKTVGFNFYFLLCLLALPKGPTDCLAVGRTLGALERNVLAPLGQFVGRSNFKYNRSRKMCSIFGREFWVEGANNESAYERIQGPTFRKVLCDEPQLWPESFWNMLQTRLSMVDSQLLGAFNPGNPNSFLKKKWLDRADDLGLNVWHFRLTRKDNPYLSQAYIDDIKASFSGVFYKWYVEGAWALTEGLIYMMFDRNLHIFRELPSPLLETKIGVDIGYTHPTAFVKMGRVVGGRWGAIDEFREQGLTPPEVTTALLKFIGSDNPTSIEVPPEEPAQIRLFREAGLAQVRPAINDVLPGITRTSTMMSQGKLFYLEKCKMIAEETEGYGWDADASKRGLDKPVKIDDDLMDAERYVVNRIATSPGVLAAGNITKTSRWKR